jgi:hypothetical protein
VLREGEPAPLQSWNDRLGRGPISLLGSGGPRRPLAPLGQPQQRLSGGVRESDSTAQGDRYPKVGGRAGPSQNRPVLRDRPHLPPHLPHLRAPPPALACGTPRHLAAHLRPARPGPSPRPPARAAPCAQPALGAARRPRAAAARAIAPPPLGGHNGAAAALLMHMHDAAPPAPPPQARAAEPRAVLQRLGQGRVRACMAGLSRGWAGAGPGRRLAAVQEVQCARPAPCVPSAPLRPRRRWSPARFLLLSTGAGPTGGGTMAGAGPRQGRQGLGLGLAKACSSSQFVTEHWPGPSGTFESFMADPCVFRDRD